jgi:6-phospho-3-hexuloisomerase
MKLQEWFRRDLEEVTSLLEGVEPVENHHIGKLILESPRVFVVGQGRTGLVMKMFAMRLMQVGIETYVVGEPTTPAINAGDLLIASSGSGRTAVVVNITVRAREFGAKIAAITSNRETPLGILADHLTIIPGESIKVSENTNSFLPMANSLEQSLLIFLDSIAAFLAEQKNETNESMMKRHANLE